MKNFKRALALLICAAMLLALCACGSSGEEAADESEAPTGLVWTSSFTDITDALGEHEDVRQDPVYSNGLLYMVAQDYGDETTPASICLFTYDLESGTCEILPNYVQPTVPEGYEDSWSDIDALCCTPDGELWVLESAQYSWYDLPEGFAGTEEEKWEYYQYTTTYALRLLDATGAELLSVDLSEIAEARDYFYVTDLKSDSDGNVYILDQNDGFWVYNTEGEQLFSESNLNTVADFSAYGLVKLADGTVGISGYTLSEYSNGIRVFDLSTKQFSNLDFEGDLYNAYDGGGDYLLYYTDGSSIYGYDAETGEGERLFSLVNCDIDDSNMRAFFPYNDAYIAFTYTYDYSTENNSVVAELATVREVDASEIPQKTTLRLAVFGLDYNLREYILKFNRSHDSHRIEVEDYSEYGTDDDYFAGLTKLSTEIVAGDVPDIISTQNMPMQQYISQGLIEDLYPYLDSDPELSREDLLESVISATEVDGGLYAAFSNFCIRTLFGKAEIVGSEPGWTVEELIDIYNSQPEGTVLLSYSTKDGILNTLLNMNLDKFVDWENVTCSFNDGRFAELLEFAAQFPDDYSYDEYSESEIDLLMSGKQLLYENYMSSFTDIQFVKAIFGENTVAKGYPTSEGVGHYIIPYDGLAITTSCVDKEAAWSFVRQVFTEDYLPYYGDFSTNRARYESELEEAMTPEYYTDPETGEQVEQSKGGMGIDDFMVDFYAMTQDEADLLQSIIDNAQAISVSDSNITDIIFEEAAAYFAGQKTAEQVADIVQNRVGTYVAEQS